mgnify:CR=1 FL=1
MPSFSPFFVRECPEFCLFVASMHACCASASLVSGELWRPGLGNGFLFVCGQHACMLRVCFFGFR